MIWGMTLHPGEEFTRKVLCDEHLTLASLECRTNKSLDGGRPRSCLLLKTGRGQHVLCTLEEGVANQHSLDLILEQGEKITFLVEGTGVVYLTGYTSRKRLRELSWHVEDSDGGNTGFDDSFQGETDVVSEKDVSDEGDDMMPESSGGHADEENRSDDGSDHGDIDDNRGNKEDDSHDDGVHGDSEKQQSDGIFKGDVVVEDAVYTPVELNAEPGNRDHQESDQDGLNLCKQEVETGLPETVTEEARSHNVAISIEPNRSKNSTKAKSPKLPVSDSAQGRDSGPSSGRRVYRCYICLESFTKKVHCTAHEEECNKGNQWKKRDKEPFRCKFCGKPFDNSCHRDLHEQTHSREKAFECRYCQKKLSTIYCLRKHERLHVNGESEVRRDHKCQLCPKSYTHKNYLVEHMRSHTGERPFQCHMCDAGFATKSARNRHIRKHQTKFRHQCQKCGKGLSSVKRLTSHMELHTKPPTNKCQYCDAAFVRTYHRIRHEKLVHLS